MLQLLMEHQQALFQLLQPQEVKEKQLEQSLLVFHQQLKHSVFSTTRESSIRLV